MKATPARQQLFEDPDAVFVILKTFLGTNNGDGNFTDLYL